MNKLELKELAIKKLHSKKVKDIKSKICQSFSDKKQKRECIAAFDKNFISAFIRSRKSK